MVRLGLGLVAGAMLLVACDGGKPAADAITPSATPPGPPTWASITADPKAYIGKRVEFKLDLLSGKILLPSGETPMKVGEAWRDASGKDWSIEPPEGGASPPDGQCLFAVADENGLPLMPLQPVGIKNLIPCQAGSGVMHVTGEIVDVSDAVVLVNKERQVIRSPILQNIELVSPN